MSADNEHRSAIDIDQEQYAKKIETEKEDTTDPA